MVCLVNSGQAIFIVYMSRLFLSLFTLLLLGAVSAEVKSKIKKKEWRISTHLEVDKQERFSFEVTVNGKKTYFSKSPVFTQRDIDKAKVIKGPAGTFGAVFRLKKQAAKRYYGIINFNKGKKLLTSVMGRKVEILTIDWAKEDRLFVVWKGLNLEEAKFIETKISTLKVKK